MRGCWATGVLGFGAQRRFAPAPQHPSTLALAALLLAFALNAPADCIPNGHFTIDASPWPYTEDLATKRDAVPIPNGVFVAYRSDGAWTRVQTGCADTSEHNVLASAPVNLLLHASLRLTSSGTAPPGTRFEVQLRVGKTVDDPDPIVAATELRRVTALPRSDRFGALVRSLPPGNYVYTMWLRVLDGPETNTVGVNLQWITAQGVPIVFPSARAEIDGATIGSAWTDVGPPLTIAPQRQVDVALHDAIDSADGSASRADVSWTIDGEAPAEHGGVAIPATGITLFDDKRAVPHGTHTLQLRMRSAGGAMLGHVRVEAFAMPMVSVWPYVMPAQHAEASNDVVVTLAGDAVQPTTMSPICGRWTKLLDFAIPPSDGVFSWTLSGFVAIEMHGAPVYGQIGFENVHREPVRGNPWLMTEAATDMGIFEFEAQPGADGIFFYGDCSKWGNFGNGGEMSLWIRIYDGCGLPVSDGTVTAGRRWLTVKLLPSPTPHF